MINFIRGKIVEKLENQVVVFENNGVGFEIISDSELFSFQEQLETIAYVILVPGDDEFRLYGFLSPQKRKFFKLLRSVSGLGSKPAIKILSAADPLELSQAIITGNTTYLVKLPGIGKKTAERIILELKSKIQDMVPSLGISLGNDSGVKFELFQNALEGLESLGYPSNKAREVLKSLMKEKKGWSVEDLIKSSLKIFLEMQH